METMIIAVVASCLGFFLASLLASAKDADTEMEMMQTTASSQNDRRREATGGASGRQVMGLMGVAHSPNSNWDETGICPSCLQVLDNDWRVEAT